MRLVAASASSRPLSLLTARSGRRGGPPGLRTARPQVQTELQLRSSSSSLSCAASPSRSPGGDDGSDSVAYLFDVISTVILQLVELSLALALLQYTAMPGNDVKAFFAAKVSTRNWGKETIIGFTVLMTLVSTTSILCDKLVGYEDAYDPILKGILSDSPTSKLLCFILYCVIAPLSEETIYRGFLLNGLSSSMKWYEAVATSSIAFSVAHLSGNSSIQLFVVGYITGLAYCRTGTLAASFTIHSLYNAVVLYTAVVS